MTAARHTQAHATTPAQSPTTVNLPARLDLLLSQSISVEDFEADVARACESDAEEIWGVLALLDQYHRLGKLPTALFRTLKSSADRRGLGRRGLPVPPPSRPAPARATADVAPPPVASPVSPAATARPAVAAAASPAVVAAAAPAVAAVPAGPALPAIAALPRVVPTLAPVAPIGVGSVLRGRYLLEAELAHDGRGTVYRAADQLRADLPLETRRVALQVLKPGTGGSAVALAELLQEFRDTQRLAHPNIIKVHEVDQDGAALFITMDLVDGEPLDVVLARRAGRPLPRAAALAIVRDIGAALVHAHEHGVVHGDLQPQCVIISESGEVRIRGFGALQAHSPYASCEQLEGRPPDARDDLYALACISYQLLHGAHPFGGLSAAEARGRGLTPARPMLLTRAQWQALRIGLAWRRENRTVGVAWWLARLRLARAVRRLPALTALAGLPAPRRPLLRPLLLTAMLGAAVAMAATYGPFPTRSSLMAGLAEVGHTVQGAPQLLRRLGDWLSPPAPTAAPARVAPAPATALATKPGANRTRKLRLAALQRAAAAPPASVEAASASAEVAAGATADPGPAAPVAQPESTAVTAAPEPARIELSADNYTVLPGESAARIVVRRHGSLQGDVSFIWWTEAASAQPSRDFIDWGRRAEQIPAGRNSVTLLVPIVSDAARRDSRLFYVTIGEAGGGASLGANARAAILMPGGG